MRGMLGELSIMMSARSARKPVLNTNFGTTKRCRVQAFKGHIVQDLKSDEG